MTNDELKALCERVMDNKTFDAKLMATECLRLLAQCEAMREALEKLEQLDPFSSINDRRKIAREALSQLGERT